MVCAEGSECVCLGGCAGGKCVCGACVHKCGVCVNTNGITSPNHNASLCIFLNNDTPKLEGYKRTTWV